MEKMIDLNSFAEGALSERFNIEMQELLRNIADPNTDAKKARKLQLTITLKADESRELANVVVQHKTTLAPARDIETKLVMDYDNDGSVIGSELKSGIKGQTFISDDGEILDDKGDKVINYPQ